ncbi:MAG: hypothetical protein KDC92_09205 [Bacteroidetes bacterium]|nr:hypothetical protein [Bacteroidota bacterium]
MTKYLIPLYLIFLSTVSLSQDSAKGDEILHSDGGPYYTESNFHNTFPEPFNMASAAVFMFIALYWYVKATRQATSFRFMKISSFILMIGGLGGTIYHGFRIWNWAMWMDWVPILILCIAASGYFVFRVYKSKLAAIVAFLLAVALQAINFWAVPDWLNTNTSYGILGVFILVPLIVALVRTRFLYWYWPLTALVAFILALTFRLGDRANWLEPIGSHFLWHTFGAIACHCMFTYLFKFKRAFPRFELIDKMRLRKIRLENFKKARLKIMKGGFRLPKKKKLQ